MSWRNQINRRVTNKENLPRFRKRIAGAVLAALSLSALLFHFQTRPPEVLLNLAFDASRPALTQLDKAWTATSQQKVSSVHAGSVHQTEALANGLVADTICVSSPGELDHLSQAKTGLVDPDWRSRFPENSSPFTSSIVFIVRRSALGEIEDWPDLFRSGRRIAVPDPHISGAGQYAYLALVYSAEQSVGSDPLKIAEALRPIHFLPYAASRSTEVFLKDTQYDALLTWESEAHRLKKNPDNRDFLVVYPSYSLQIEAVVAIAEAPVE
jgi:sulfate transport system substrate-binding protein